MKLIILALILSISVHFLIFSSYEKNTVLEKTNIQKINHKKNKLTYVKLKKAPPPKKIKKVKKIKKAKKNTPKIKKQKVPKNRVYKKKTITKKVSKKLIKIKKPKTLENFLSQKKPEITKSKIQKSTLEDFLQQKDPINQEMLSQIERLYGREFESFTKVQKAFLKKNIDNFQQITQKVLSRLGYPRLAGKLGISGRNIVEFIFYPNGAIKNLKITSSSGYTIFDDYTLELIQIAYKDYPRPKTATKLKFNVTYRLY